MDIKCDVLNITSSKSKKLSIFKYNALSNPIGVIVFTSAMGVKQKYYRHYANYLASKEFVVYSFDYSDIGESREGSIRKSNTTVLDWIAEIKLVTNMVFEIHSEDDPKLPFYYLTHSLGGQLFGFLNTQNKFKGMIGITSQNGYWKFYKTKFRYFMFWYFMMVPLTKLFGYFPSRKVGFGEDLPPKVAKRWKKWCTSRNYFFDDEIYNKEQKFEQYKGPILTLSFDDDPWATEDAVGDLYDRYVNSKRDHKHILPKEVNIKKIGHVGFFRPGSEIVWETTLNWIINLNK